MDDDDMGLDFDLESLPKKPPPRRNRRLDGILPHSPSATSEPTSPLSEAFSSEAFDNFGPPQPPPRSRKTGGWADDIPPSAKREAPKVEKRIDADDSDSEMPVIPDLDEVKEEDLATQIAQAPAVAVNRVATYQELDSDLLKHISFATLDGIDLRLLTKCLAPEAEIKEDDVPWTWDILFTDVSSQLNEWEGKQEVEASI